VQPDKRKISPASPFDESGSKMKMRVEYWCKVADRGKWKYPRKASPIVTAFKTNSTLTVQEKMPDFRVQRLVTISLIHLSYT